MCLLPRDFSNYLIENNFFHFDEGRLILELYNNNVLYKLYKPYNKDFYYIETGSKKYNFRAGFFKEHVSVPKKLFINKELKKVFRIFKRKLKFLILE